MGMVAAQSDSFLQAVVSEIGSVVVKDMIAELQRDMSVKEWLQTLLADINNQTSSTDRLINRDCIFKWVQVNMSAEAAHEVFYDDERRAEFAGQDPERPTETNQYQPFLSCKVLSDMLLKAGMLTACAPVVDPFALHTESTSSRAKERRVRPQEQGDSGRIVSAELG